MEKNREKAWEQSYVTDRKWWTRFVLTESTISSPWRSFDPRPSPDFSPRLQDKIWEWPGDEASHFDACVTDAFIGMWKTNVQISNNLYYVLEVFTDV